MAVIDNSPDIAEIMNTLGTSSTDIQTLCQHPNINMWSKRKPVRDNRLTVPDDEIGRGEGDWGLALPGWSGNDSALTTYKAPRGGINEPFRFQDFKGYAHDAQKPAFTGPQPSELTASIQWIIIGLALSTGTSVSLFDFAGNGLRPGVQVYKDGVPFNAASAKDGGSVIEVDLSGLAGNYLTFKFGLVDYYKPWENVMGLNFLYELPRSSTTDCKNWTDVRIVTENQSSEGSGGSGTTYAGVDILANYKYTTDGIQGTGYFYINHDKDKLAGLIEAGHTQFKAYISNGHDLISYTNTTRIIEYSISDLIDYDPGTFYGGVEDGFNQFLKISNPSMNLSPTTLYTCATYFYDSGTGTWKLFGWCEFETFFDPDENGSIEPL